MGLASQLREAVRKVKLSKTERKILEQAAAHSRGMFSTTRASGRGYRRGGEGNREFDAADKLVRRGLATEVQRTTDREATSAKARDKVYITLSIKITDAGRKALG